MPTKKAATDLPPELIDLALLALQLRGGARVAHADPVLKPLKTPILRAVDAGLAEAFTERHDHPTQTDAKGRRKRVTQKFYRLTKRGHQHLVALADPDAARVSAALMVRQLRREITDAVAELQQSVAARLDAGLGELVERLEGIPAGREVATSDPVVDGLAWAYRELCTRVEYESGLVDIPRIFYKLRQRLPDLDLATLHTVLEEMWAAGRLQLRVLNEVHRLSEEERSMGIWQDGGLHYYVDWPGAR